MLLPDVNLLVYAQRDHLPAYADAKRWLESALNLKTEVQPRIDTD